MINERTNWSTKQARIDFVPAKRMSSSDMNSDSDLTIDLGTFHSYRNLLRTFERAAAGHALHEFPGIINQSLSTHVCTSF